MLIGAHVSIAGGIFNAIEQANRIGVNAIQTFASPPRAIRNISYPTHEAIELYKKKRKSSHISYHVFHGLYLINLAHHDREYIQVCTKALQLYQHLAGEIQAAGTCFHIGSHKGKGLHAVLPAVTQAIYEVMETTPNRVKLILEITAGQQGAIGAQFEDLARVFEAVSNKGANMDRLKVAWDTQHAFASGYPIHTEDGLEQTITRFDELIGLNALELIHLNDSAVPFSSHKDRHENLGSGLIGHEALARIVQHPKLNHLPFILEVPGIKKSGPDIDDVNQLKMYAQSV